MRSIGQTFQMKNNIGTHTGGCIVLARDADWIGDCWKKYLRPKYRAALTKWNKETGEGKGNPANSYKYTSSISTSRVVLFLPVMPVDKFLHISIVMLGFE
jgi:hypothetical protein